MPLSPQIYVNLGDNSDLDSQGFAPFGTISPADMVTFNKIYAGQWSKCPCCRRSICACPHTTCCCACPPPSASVHRACCRLWAEPGPGLDLLAGKRLPHPQLPQAHLHVDGSCRVRNGSFKALVNSVCLGISRALFNYVFRVNCSLLLSSFVNSGFYQGFAASTGVHRGSRRQQVKKRMRQRRCASGPLAEAAEGRSTSALCQVCPKSGLFGNSVLLSRALAIFFPISWILGK
jgi:hypothetical protein